MLSMLNALTPNQRNAAIASYFSWTLDAFDFFILVFVLKDVADEFHTSKLVVSWAIFLTLAARPVGALIFGLLADKVGRRPALMIDISLFSALAFITGFSPNLVSFFII